MLPETLFTSQYSLGLIESLECVPWHEVEFLYLDLPWHFRVRSRKGLSRSAENHYPTLTNAEMKKLPLGDLLAKNAWVLMWVTEPTLEEALDLAKGWGLKYKTFAFTWIKPPNTARNTLEPGIIRAVILKSACS